MINLNLEEFVERVDQLLEQNPWQKTIRYDVEQDVLAIEPIRRMRAPGGPTSPAWTTATSSSSPRAPAWTTSFRWIIAGTRSYSDALLRARSAGSTRRGPARWSSGSGPPRNAARPAIPSGSNASR